MKHFISVIVPIFNVEAYLEKCLISIVNQSYTNFEVIMINDGSTDCSLTIAEKFAKKDGRFKLWTTKNGGLSRARNMGLSKAAGEFIAFIDSDDWTEKNYLEILVGHINKDIDIVTTQLIYSFRSHDNRPRSYEKTYSPAEYLKEVLIGKFKCHVCGKLFRSKLFDELIFDEGILYEDVMITPDLLKQARNIRQIDYHGYFYRQRESGISRGIKSDDFVHILNAHINFRLKTRRMDIPPYYYTNHFIDFYSKPLLKSFFTQTLNEQEFLEVAAAGKTVKVTLHDLIHISPKNTAAYFTTLLPIFMLNFITAIFNMFSRNNTHS